MTGTIAVIMVFSIPLVAIISGFWVKNSEAKNRGLEKEYELEKIKHENFILETEKLRLELEKMKIEDEQKRQNLFVK